jgi:S1-C subfamily serine protease
MWPQKADLLGLAIGFGLGGAVLVGYLRDIEAALQPTPPPAQLAQSGPPDALATPPIVRQIAPPAPALSRSVLRGPAPAGTELLGPALPGPVALPHIVSPDRPPDGTVMPSLPVVIEPTLPQKSAGKAGTGFFIAADGSLLTVAHVVTDCRRTEVLSRLVKPIAVDILARDSKLDIALLRARHVHPPGILALGRPGSRQMVVFGYPASAGPIIPSETSATLENDKFPQPLNALTDPREVVWIEAGAVTHGYSGGPILDPDNGAVIGIVRGMVDTGRLGFVRGMPASGVTIGPGAGRLASFLRRVAPDLDMAAPLDTGDTVLDDARRATVHVICWN